MRYCDFDWDSILTHWDITDLIILKEKIDEELQKRYLAYTSPHTPPE